MSTGSNNIRGPVGLAGAVAAPATAGSPLPLEALPPGVQANHDHAAGLDRAINVSGQDPTKAEVVGSALTVGKPAVPWAVFRRLFDRGRS